jgi:3-methyladenine DNA glycosylase Tag
MDQNNNQVARANEVTAAITPEMLEASANLTKLKVAINLSPEYIELVKAGESFRGIFWGFTEITVNDQVTGEQRTIAAAAFLVDKAIRINAGVALVGECKKSGIDKGTPVEVTFKEKKGNLKIYSLTLLG